MKRIFIIITCILSFITADAKKDIDDSLNIRIGTYNIWSHVARKGQISKKNALPSRGWDESKESIADLIVKLDCDLIGMQEVTIECRDDLERLVKKAGGKYNLWWVNTYPADHKTPVGNAVFYKKKAFSIENQSIYYYSPTPEVISKGWDEKKYYRAALTATVTHKKSGRRFFFIATHGPLADEASSHAGEILVEIDKKYNTECLPTIVVGDMNVNPTEPFYIKACSYYEDTYEVAEKKCGNIGTFNGSKEDEASFELIGRRIDHIYIHSTEKGKILVRKYTVNRDKYEVCEKLHYPSDHNPVIVDLILN